MFNLNMDTLMIASIVGHSVNEVKVIISEINCTEAD